MTMLGARPITAPGWRQRGMRRSLRYASSGHVYDVAVSRGAGADTVLGRVVQLLADVERASVPLLRLFERRAGAWLPLVVAVAATTLFFTEDLSRAIAVLVVATPTLRAWAAPPPAGWLSFSAAITAL